MCPALLEGEAKYMNHFKGLPPEIHQRSLFPCSCKNGDLCFESENMKHQLKRDFSTPKYQLHLEGYSVS